MTFAVLHVFFTTPITLVTVFVVILIYFEWCYSYWKKKNVPYIPPKFPWGNFEDTFKGKYGVAFVIKKYYEEFKKRNQKHGGLYILSSPVYIPVDPEYLRNVLSKDFQNFTDRGYYYNEKHDPLSAHLFSLGGTKWRNLRTKFTLMFSPAKIKGMVQLLGECGRNLEVAIGEYCQNGEVIDIKQPLSEFSTDIIVSCAFGVECNSLKEHNNPFVIHGMKFFETTVKRRVKTLFAYCFPNLARMLGFLAIPPEVSKFYLDTVKETVRKRTEGGTTRRDFLQQLIDLKKREEKEQIGGSLTLEQIAAQCTIFLAAGYESSSTTLTFCLYELSMNQQIQDKVREEIRSIIDGSGGEITYDGLMEMNYTEQVINETLRKYPPAPALPRLCVKDYKTPDGVVLEKGTKVFIPIIGLHRDPQYFPEPEKFDPERFSDDNKKNLVPFTYMPFGEGPRICIAQKFGILECKVALAYVLKGHKFYLNEKTQNPLKLNAGNIGIVTENTVYLDVIKC